MSDEFEIIYGGEITKVKKQKKDNYWKVWCQCMFFIWKAWYQRNWHKIVIFLLCLITISITIYGMVK